MKFTLFLVAAAAGLWLLHRLALWMEARGWIYYARRKPDPASLGSAFLELQQLAEPQKRHVLERKQEQRAEQAESGGPKHAGQDQDSPPETR